LNLSSRYNLLIARGYFGPFFIFLTFYRGLIFYKRLKIALDNQVLISANPAFSHFLSTLIVIFFCLFVPVSNIFVTGFISFLVFFTHIFAENIVSEMKAIRIILPVAMTLLAACGSRETVQKEPPTVKTITIEHADGKVISSYIGTVESIDEVALSFQTMGTVEQVFVKEGDRVSKGQVLAVLDKTNLKSVYESSKATLRQAEDAYKRMEKLHSTASITEIQWVDVKTKLQNAKSMEEVSRKSLEDATLKSPVSGFLSRKLVDAGEIAVMGQPVFCIVDLNRLTVGFTLSEDEIGNVNVGDKVQVSRDGFSFEGKISSKGVAPDIVSRTYKVTVNLPSCGGKILPGMVCRVTLAERTGQSGIVVPQSCVKLNFDNTCYVWIVDAEGKASRRAVTIGGATYSGTLILSGLESGDQVIVEGMQKVSDGMEVRQ